jgi:glycosyltransferase involved in cell wall biosynthesis
MSARLKISVITPSFNSGDHIERAIKSVLDQDYPDWEHIIIDGGSTDSTLEILNKYGHLHWISEPDAGQADAMNKGFHQSTGDIIVYLNADDYFFPGAFSAVITEFERGAEFVVGNVFVKSPRMQTEFLNTPRITLEGMLRHWEPNAFCNNPLGYFYLREVQKICPFNKDNYSTMDLEFLLDAASKFRFTKVNHTLGCYEDSIETKTGVTQSKLDYWMPSTFPYLDKHLTCLSEEQKIIYEKDRRSGYVSAQEYMNRFYKYIFADELPLISIIIPTYNCSKWLRRAIESVLTQGLQNLEVIVIDDASTDETQYLLKTDYENDPTVHIIRNDENMGVGASLNKGFDAAKGKYVFFLNADDWLAAGALKHLASIAEEYSAEIVECGVNKIWENGGADYYHAHAFAVNGGIEALYHFAEYRIGGISFNKLYSREFIKNINLHFDVSYLHEDTLFTAQAVYLCKKYISITDAYYNYFQKNDSITKSKSTPLHLKSYIKLYADMIKFIKHNSICNDSKGKELCSSLLKAHCSNEIYPSFMKYLETHSREEWETDCCIACYDMLGVNGYAVADFLIRVGLEIKSTKATLEGRSFFCILKDLLSLHKLFILLLPQGSSRNKMIVNFWRYFKSAVRSNY